MVVKTEGISVCSRSTVNPTFLLTLHCRALLASAAGAELNRHSLHGLQDLWHQMYAEPYEQLPMQVN